MFKVNVEVDLSGWSNFLSGQFPTKAQEMIGELQRSVEGAVSASLDRNVPVDTGRLKDSIEFRRVPYKESAWVTRLRYAVPVHEGWSAHTMIAPTMSGAKAYAVPLGDLRQVTDEVRRQSRGGRVFFKRIRVPASKGTPFFGMARDAAVQAAGRHAQTKLNELASWVTKS